MSLKVKQNSYITETLANSTKSFSFTVYKTHLENIYDSYCAEHSFWNFESKFLSVVNKHAPLKMGIVRANNEPLTNTHRIATKLRTKLKSKFNKCQAQTNFENYGRQRSHCANLRQRAKSEYSKNFCQNGTLDSKAFWQWLKPFFFGKSRSDSDICLLEKDSLVTNPKHVVEIMNDFFFSIGEQSVTDHMNIEPHSFIDNIVEKYKNHSSIKNIKRNFKEG